jgi:hypothetical protein
MPTDVELVPLFVISPEDIEYRAMKILTEGYETVECPNIPLGFKKNAGLKYALGMSWDYYMDMGSDDVWTPRLWELYEPYFREQNPYFGLKNCYKYSVLLDRGGFVEGYHLTPFNDDVTAMGPGRCIRRDVVESNYPLWNDTAPFGMDGYSDEKIQSAGVICTVVDNERLPVICGTKSGICLTPFDDVEDRMDTVDTTWLKDVFDLWGVSMDTTTLDGFHTTVCRVSKETRTIGDAFEVVNQAHEVRTGDKRYANLESYKVQISKRNRR